MTESYLKNITPDSLSGLIFGFEGVRHTLTILNGPTGCKFYNSITVENQSTRKDDFDPLKFPEVWFFGQGRVPCTYLDKRDYVYGSEDKLGDAIKETLSRTKPELLVIVNSPGAALIGDDLERIAKNALNDSTIPFITCQSPGYSKDVIDGYREACRMIMEKFCGNGEGEDCSLDEVMEENSVIDEAHKESGAGKRPTEESGAGEGLTEMSGAGEEAAEKSGIGKAGNRPVVNLLGLSIYQKYHAGDIAEMTRLLSLSGISVNTSLLCESTVEEIRRVPDADLNVVIDKDWGMETAELLKEKYGTPFVYSEYGYPVGFKAMEKLISDICAVINTADPEVSPADLEVSPADLEVNTANPEVNTADPEPALESLKRARAKAYIQIARMNSLTGLPKGTPFTVQGSPARVTGYSRFLTEYLGMTESEKDSEKDAEIVLADGNYIAMEKAKGRKFSGIEIALPTIGYIDVIDKTHLGSIGTLLLIEQILNGLVY